jgi:hypothetical protein
MGFDTKTYGLTDRQSQNEFDFDLLRTIAAEAREQASKEIATGS